MEKQKNSKLKEQSQVDDENDFLLKLSDFSEKTKLQNKVLKKIIEQIDEAQKTLDKK